MVRVPGPGHSSLGAWTTQKEAAEAYDRAVLYYRGEQARRNFPGKHLVPADVRALQKEARARAKRLTSSQFNGVVRVAPTWVAQVKVRGRYIGLGHWPTEIAAATAYDRAVCFYRLDKRTLNFPHRRLTPPFKPRQCTWRFRRRSSDHSRASRLDKLLGVSGCW